MIEAQQALWRQAEQERLSRQMTDKIRQSLDLDVILESTVTEIRTFLQTDRVLVYRFNADGSGDMIVEAVEPGWISVLGHTLRDPCFRGERVEKYRHDFVGQIDDVHTAPVADCYRELLRQYQVQAILSLPLIVEDCLWGLLCIHHCQAPRPWTPEEVAFVKQISDQVEIAIQQSQLLEQTAIRARREKLLNDIVKTVRESLDLQATLERTTNKLLDAFQVSRCLITLCAATDDYFECTAVAALPGISTMEQHRIRKVGNPLAEQVLSQEAPIALTNLFEDPALSPLFPLAKQFDIVAVLAVSIRYQGQVQGMLAIHHRLSRRWTEDECILIQQVADQLAIAIQQAALYEQAQVEIAERVRLEEQLRHDAFHDALTGLPNRALFLDRLKFALQRFQRWQRQHTQQSQLSLAHPPTAYSPYEHFAVLFLDLDRFKIINDSLGHTFGDQLLKLVAGRLTNCLRDVDMAARLGGDEFVVLLEELTNPQFAIEVARRIHNVLEVPICLDGREVFVHASIGIAFGSTNYTEPSQILRDADIAMYQAKHSKQDYVVFDASMHVIALQQMNLEHDLRHAIKRQEFRLHYQPIISLTTGRIVSFEALVRWQHPTQGLLYPGAFMDIAEDTGLITSIDFWVLQEALRQLRSWHLQFPELANLTISVNLSGKQFSQPDLISQIDYALTTSQLAGRHLKLEITESVLIKNDALAIATLNQFRERHIQVCMDDFGTGYSSLSYLHRFPVDVLKIDKSFILNLLPEHASSRDYEIVRAIINLALNLNLEVVAEGIENEVVLNYLKQNGCQFGQGHLFAMAVDSQAATQALHQQSGSQQSKEMPG
jgi:diguanylate cyclase (GGDEF)-like protein